jgi:hypothetical protein
MIKTTHQMILDKKFKVSAKAFRANFPAFLLMGGHPDSDFVAIEGEGQWPEMLANWMVQEPRVLMWVTQACLQANMMIMSVPPSSPLGAPDDESLPEGPKQDNGSGDNGE